MSPEQSNHTALNSAGMTITSDSRIVAYVPGQHHLVPHRMIDNGLPISVDDPASRRDNRFHLPLYTRPAKQPYHPEAAYNSNLRMEEPKMTQVGLLIDIYA